LTENSKCPEKFAKIPKIQIHEFKQSGKVSFIFNESFERTVDSKVQFLILTKNSKCPENFEKIPIIQINVFKKSGKVSFILNESFERTANLNVHYGKNISHTKPNIIVHNESPAPARDYRGPY
jgi:hypothetical protein